MMEYRLKYYKNRNLPNDCIALEFKVNGFWFSRWKTLIKAPTGVLATKYNISTDSSVLDVKNALLETGRLKVLEESEAGRKEENFNNFVKRINNAGVKL